MECLWCRKGLGSRNHLGRLACRQHRLPTLYNSPDMISSPATKPSLETIPTSNLPLSAVGRPERFFSQWRLCDISLHCISYPRQSSGRDFAIALYYSLNLSCLVIPGVAWRGVCCCCCCSLLVSLPAQVGIEFYSFLSDSSSCVFQVISRISLSLLCQSFFPCLFIC